MNRTFDSSAKREAPGGKRAGNLWMESRFATFVDNALCVFLGT